MKWINNIDNIKFTRGDHRPIIAKFDNMDKWFNLRAMATEQSQKSNIKALGDHLGANQCEVKYLYDGDDNVTESEENIVFFSFINDDVRFYTLTDAGTLQRILIK